MIYFKQTGESFSDIYCAKDAVLRFARGLGERTRAKAELVLDAGVYTLEKPLVFSSNEEPALWHVLLSLVCEDGKATLTSQKSLNASDFRKTGDYYTYQFPKNKLGEYPRFRDFYVNGRRLPICRTESFIHNFDFSEDNERINSENLEGIYIPEEAAALIPDGAPMPMEITLYVEWEFFVLHAVGIDKTRTKLDEDGKKHVLLKIDEDELYNYVGGMNKCLQPKNREFFLGNNPAFLAEDTWCYDVKTGVLCYCPKNEMCGEFSVATLEKLVCFEGMDGIRLENIGFTGTTDKFVCEKGFLSHQANVEKRLGNKVEAAGVFARNVRRFTAEKCNFYEMGTNGILMLGELAMIYIRNSRFENIAMSGMSVGNPTRASREKRNCSFDVRIENNFLSHIAYEFPTAPAVDVFRVDGLSICRNTIEYCAYSGVSVGWEWGSLKYALGEMVNIRDAEISHNRVLHHMQLLRDGGAIYVVGSNCTKEYTRFFNFMHDNFAYRDSVKRTVRGYYLDGSSSNWHVYDNVVSGAQRPAFAQFIVPEQYAWNNLIENTYTTEEITPENHCPERNTLLGSIYTEPTLDELFRKYPKAKDIFEKSGCREI